MATFNEFVQFISDDPIMLGLCIAVVVLIIVFFIVLCMGNGKSEELEEKKVEENTTQLLATDVNDEPLRSTQQLNLSNELKEVGINLAPKQVEPYEGIVDLTEKEVPISIDEAINLKTTRENEQKDTVQIPVVEETPVAPVEIPIAPIKVNTEPEIPVIPAVEPVMPQPAPAPVVEPTVMQTASEGMPTQHFSSVYLNEGETLPVDNSNIFDKTDIIRHIPVMEDPIPVAVPETPVPVATVAPTTIESAFVQEEPKVEPVEENMDDIELPKLNTNSETSVLNTLSGEWFNIN